MYEARRQRSSWARIKLSIVRKFMSIGSLRFLLDFALIRVRQFYLLLNQQVFVVFSYSIFKVQILLNNISDKIWQNYLVENFFRF